MALRSERPSNFAFTFFDVNLHIPIYGSRKTVFVSWRSEISECSPQKASNQLNSKLGSESILAELIKSILYNCPLNYSPSFHKLICYKAEI